MTKKYTYKISILDGNKEIASAPMSYSEISSFVSNLQDESTNNNLFKVLAMHPSVSVRETVAYKDKINEAVFQILAEDSEVSVIRNLVRSDGGKNFSSTEQLKKWISMDSEVAQNIAGYIDRYNNSDIDELASTLVKHSDPAVIASLADNSDTPKKILKNLLKHADPEIASKAKRTLE